MDDSDWIAVVVTIIMVACSVAFIAVQVGADLMLGWVCTDNGYEGAFREYGTRYFTYENEDGVVRFVPLDSLVEDR